MSHHVLAKRLQEQHLMDNYVCTACHGPLVLKPGGGAVFVNGKYTTAALLVVCARGCRPAGFVARSAVDQARHAALTLADEQRVEALLAEHANNKIDESRLTDEQRANIAARIGLWQEDD